MLSQTDRSKNNFAKLAQTASCLHKRVALGQNIICNDTPAGFFTVDTPGFIAIGIFKKSDPEVLLKNLDAPKYYERGKYPFFWDGTNNEEVNIIATNDYFPKILYHNIQIDWSTGGNTSTTNHGPTLYKGYSRALTICHTIDSYVWFTLGYNEGSGEVCYKANKLGDVQSKISVLKYPATGSKNPNDTNSVLPYSCSNDTKIFFAGSNGGALGNIIHGIVLSTGAEIIFTNGYVVDIPTVRRYNSVIGDNDPAHKITGLCCNNNILWVSYDVGKIEAYDIAGATPTGNLLSSTPVPNNPRKLGYHKLWDHVWYLGGTYGPNTKTMGEIDPVTGAITDGYLTISDFPNDAVSLGIDNKNNRIIFACGGPQQQLIAYNIAPQYPAGNKKVWTHGRYGGMQNNVNVTNDSFCFTDPTTPYSFGLSDPSISVDETNGDIWFTDPGNERILVKTENLVYIKTIAWQPSMYATGQNLTNAKECYIGALCWEELSPNNWVLTKNYRASLSANYITNDLAGIFETVSTFEGRTYATIRDISTLPFYTTTELIELTPTGIRYSGIPLNPGADWFNGTLDHNFNIDRITSVSWAVGGTPQLKRKTRTGIDGAFNPIWSAEVVLSTFEPIILGGALNTTDGVGALGGTTESGVSIVKNISVAPDCKTHLEGYKNGKKTFAIYRPTTAQDDDPALMGYNGQYTDEYNYMRGGGVRNTFAGVKVLKKWFFTLYYGEFLYGNQSNIITGYDENGLAMFSVGVVGALAELIEESAPQNEGNAISWHIAMDPTDPTKAILVHGGESKRGALSVWKFSRLNTYKITNGELSTVPSIEPKPGVSMMGDVVLNTVLATGGRITRGHAQSSFSKIESGVLSYKKSLAEVYNWLDASGGVGISRPIDTEIDPIDPTTGTIKFYAELNFRGYNGGEPIGLYPEIPTCANYQFLDENYNIVNEIGLGQGTVFNQFKLKGNNTDLMSYYDAYTHFKTLGEWQKSVVTISASGCIINYNGIEISTPFYNPEADWSKIKYVRSVTRIIANAEGQRVIAHRDLRVEQLTTGAVAPSYISSKTIDSHTIEGLLNQSTSVNSMAGFSATANGSPLTITSIVFNGRKFTITVSETLIDTDDIKISYSQILGITARATLNLTSFTNQTVTNTLIPAGAAIIRQALFDNTASNSITMNGIDPNTLLIGVESGTIGAFGTSCSGTNGNSPTLLRDEHIFFGTSLSVFYKYNANPGTTTFNFSGISSNLNIAMFEISGPDFGADPLLLQDGAQEVNPLTKSLIVAIRALVFAAYANGNGSNYVSVGGGLTEDNVSGNNAFATIKNQLPATINPAINISATPGNAAVFGVFKLP